MKVARYADLNDPFELMAGDLSDKDFRRAVSTLKREFHKNRGLLCFSKSWHNPVLWSHYAEKHRGIALGFDVNDEYVEHIKYSDKRLPVKYKNGNQDNDLDSNFVRDLLRTKYQHWAYEEEIRLHVDIKDSKSEGGLYFTEYEDVGIELKEVILGHSCDVPIDKIRNLVNINYNNIKVTKARLAFQEFKVVTDQRSNISE